MLEQPKSPPSTSVGFAIVRITLGALLLMAAWLKAISFWNGHPPGPVFSSPHWQIGIIELETVVGLFLLSGVYSRGAWLAAIALFTALSGVALYLAMDGQQYCKCFGDVKVSPWVTFGIDAAAVLALLVWRPSRSQRRPAAWVRAAMQPVLGATTILALISGAFLLASGDPVRSLALLRGESITVDPAVSDIGNGSEGEQRELILKLTNNTDQPVCIVGGTTAGYCLATLDLPTTVPARERRSIRVLVLFRGSIGRFQHPFVLYTDDARQPVVTVGFAGRVIEKTSQ